MNQLDDFDMDAAYARRELAFQCAAIRLEWTMFLWSSFMHPDAREPDDDTCDDES